MRIWEAREIIRHYCEESDAGLRAVIDSIPNRLNPDRLNWWHPYELRDVYPYKGKLFREFLCIAGSVQVWLWKLAREHNLRQIVLLPDEKNGIRQRDQ